MDDIGVSRSQRLFHQILSLIVNICRWTFWELRMQKEPLSQLSFELEIRIQQKTQQLVELKPNHNQFCFKQRPACISAVAWLVRGRLLLSPFEVIKVIYFELGMTEDGKPQVLNVRVSQSTFNLWFGPMYLFWGKKWSTSFNQKLRGTQ